MIVINYQAVSYEEFKDIVSNMITYASSGTFDSVQETANAKKNNQLKVSEVNEAGLVRIRGHELLDVMKPYTKFLLMGEHAFQITYYEMEVPEAGRFGQLTVVDNQHIEIDEDLVFDMAAEFFPSDEPNDFSNIQIMKETPPHVIVAVCRV